MIKIILVREATDREPNFATTEVSEIKSSLEKDAFIYEPLRTNVLHPLASYCNKAVIK